MKNKRSQLLLLLMTSILQAQDYSARVLDSISQEPIPFANITVSNKTGVISNEEGRFRIRYSDKIETTDTLIISSMGYHPYRKALATFSDSLIYLAPQPIALNSVIVSNKQMDIETIMENILTNIKEKYEFGVSQKQLFLRESGNQEFLRMQTDITKSSIPEFNQRFFDSILKQMPQKNAYYLETLADLYGDLTKETQKINIIKAVELIDKKNEISFENFEKRFNSILNKRIKKDSYFKIKSGWFGNKVEAEDFFDMEEQAVDSTDLKAQALKLKEDEKNDSIRKRNFSKGRKNVLAAIFSSLFEDEEWKIKILKKDYQYNFELTEYTFLGDTPVYIVAFNPKNKAKFQGTLYIDADRLVLTRIDYKSTQRLRNFKLLGLYFRHQIQEGKIIFKLLENEKYALHYFEQKNGFEAGIDRPLKIIEKNKNVKGRRKQNELAMDLKLDMAQENKLEILVFDTQRTTQEIYQNFKEDNQRLPERIQKYDPEIWKDYNIIEPNQSIKALKVLPDQD